MFFLAYGGLVRIEYKDVLEWSEEERTWYIERLIEEKEKERKAMKK